MVRGSQGREVKKIGLGVKIHWIGQSARNGVLRKLFLPEERRNRFPGVKVRVDGRKWK